MADRRRSARVKVKGSDELPNDGVNSVSQQNIPATSRGRNSKKKDTSRKRNHTNEEDEFYVKRHANEEEEGSSGEAEVESKPLRRGTRVKRSTLARLDATESAAIRSRTPKGAPASSSSSSGRKRSPPEANEVDNNPRKRRRQDMPDESNASSVVPITPVASEKKRGGNKRRKSPLSGGGDGDDDDDDIDVEGEDAEQQGEEDGGEVEDDDGDEEEEDEEDDGEEDSSLLPEEEGEWSGLQAMSQQRRLTSRQRALIDRRDRGELDDQQLLSLPMQSKAKKAITEEEQQKKAESALRRKRQQQRQDEEEKELTIRKLLSRTTQKKDETPATRPERTLDVPGIRYISSQEGQASCSFPEGYVPVELAVSSASRTVPETKCVVCRGARAYLSKDHRPLCSALACYRALAQQPTSAQKNAGSVSV